MCVCEGLWLSESANANARTTERLHKLSHFHDRRSRQICPALICLRRARGAPWARQSWWGGCRSRWCVCCWFAAACSLTTTTGPSSSAPNSSKRSNLECGNYPAVEQTGMLYMPVSIYQFMSKKWFRAPVSVWVWRPPVQSETLYWTLC